MCRRLWLGGQLIAAALESVIRDICAELQTSDVPLNWRTLGEDNLLFEAAVCIVGSQIVEARASPNSRRYFGELSHVALTDNSDMRDAGMARIL